MILVWMLIFGVITGAIADKYERNVAGWAFFGCMFFLLALPWILIAGPLGKKCRHCKENIKSDARVCKHCGSNV